HLFYRNLPRLSVDIDLTYLPVNDLDASLDEIDETLTAIMEDAKNLRGDGETHRWRRWRSNPRSC
ncbi:MAG: nucleotidyl transferase AbiEii/AbiGii toxin family protein, partial [Rhodobacter sp.]|nr:nucleotidyl transferase AbiEii/AbiGii toxin family protein [Rhodobacter sp.]